MNIGESVNNARSQYWCQSPFRRLREFDGADRQIPEAEHQAILFDRDWSWHRQKSHWLLFVEHCGGRRLKENSVLTRGQREMNRHNTFTGSTSGRAEIHSDRFWTTDDTSIAATRYSISRMVDRLKGIRLEVTRTGSFFSLIRYGDDCRRLYVLYWRWRMPYIKGETIPYRWAVTVEMIKHVHHHWSWEWSVVRIALDVVSRSMLKAKRISCAIYVWSDILSTFWWKLVLGIFPCQRERRSRHK